MPDLLSVPRKTLWKISRLTGEFLDPGTESLYFETEIHAVSSHLRLITVALGLLFLSFAIPDWFVMDSRGLFAIVLAIRLVFFIYMILLGFLLKKARPSYRLFCRWITWTELLCIAMVIAVFILYDNVDFLIQAFGLMLLLSTFYLLPNRFANQLMVSLIAIAAFLNGAWILLDTIDPMHMTAVAVYLILVMAVSTVAAVRTSYYKRRQYVNSQRQKLLSITDPLTRIYNRQKFNVELWREISRFRRTKAPLSVVLMDFDEFKTINDRFGHLQGDRVLVEAVAAMRDIIRITDVLARWGGEEFVLLLPGTTLEQAGELAERLRRTICELRLDSSLLLQGTDNKTDVRRMQVSCSFGIAIMHEDDTPESLIRRADAMLYRAKDQGKNRTLTETDEQRL